MQTQRDKEQVLIDRGEQYKRAIQLFVKKAGRYPAKIEDLESFQNQRFLRQRYTDPMTGKDEWRLIHIQNGILTDSKIMKPNSSRAAEGWGHHRRPVRRRAIGVRRHRKPAEWGRRQRARSSPRQ